MPASRAASLSCPSDEELGAFVEGRLARAQLRRLAEHLRGCDGCCELVERYASAWQLGASPRATLSQVDEPLDGARSLQPGQRFGRYVVLYLAGTGGMGEVHAVYDPLLDRRVALKLLHARAGADRRASALDEARTIAALEHPHIVTIYDVGHAHGRDYIAMELVEGGSLAQWLTAARPTRRAIVEVFRQAGLGLAAAHRHGVVHRDFKPANVLVGCDRHGHPQRVCVADFGLAAPRGVAAGRAGTRGYVAPEQAAGAAPDPLADQYSFCVALAEALGGAETAVTESAPQPRAAPDVVPAARRIARVLARGSDPLPARRYPSMEAMLDALAPRRRTWVIAAAAVVGVMALLPMLSAGQRSECPPTDLLRAELWGEPARAHTAATFADSELPFAATAWTHAQRALDTEIDGWAARTHAACVAGDAEALACVAQRRARIEQALVVLADADATTITNAASVVDLDLPPCERGAPPQGHEHTRLATALAAGKSLRAAGHPLDARSQLERTIDDARNGGDEPILREAQLELAGMLPSFGEADRASSVLAEVAYASLAVGNDHTALSALVALVRVDGAHRSDFDAAARWDRDATAVLARVGDPPRERAQLERAHGAIALARGDGAGAIAPMRTVLVWAEAEYGPDDLHTASALRDLGLALFSAEQLTEAAEVIARAETIREAQLGMEHPDVAGILGLRFAIERAEGRHADAVATARRALAIHERTAGSDHLETIDARMRFGLALEAIDVKAAREPTAAALAAYERVVGVGHSHTESARLNLAQLDLQLGDYEAALAEARTAHAGLHALYGDEHTHVNAAGVAVGNALRKLGRLDEARPWLVEALAHSGAVHTARRAVTSDALAQLEHDAGNLARAIELWHAGADAWVTAYGAEHAEAKTSRGLAVAAEAELARRQLTRRG